MRQRCNFHDVHVKHVQAWEEYHHANKLSCQSVQQGLHCLVAAIFYGLESSLQHISGMHVQYQRGKI